MECTFENRLVPQDILLLLQQKPPLVQDYVNLEDQVQPNGFDLTLKEVLTRNPADALPFQMLKDRSPALNLFPSLRTLS
jgi:dUTP pyrophosphatase